MKFVREEVVIVRQLKRQELVSKPLNNVEWSLKTLAEIFYKTTFRSNRPEVFYKKCVLKNFPKSTGKHVVEVILVFLLLTLNIFHTFF